jgi:uncharacterized protein (DUF1697 family)
MRYVALLRGIMPMNPNMRGEKLREVFESLGFTNVATVIASGNVIFDSPSKNVAALEKKIEEALPKKLKFTSTTIIRSQKEIEALVKKNPYKGIKDEKPNYFLVTFFKDHRKELCSVIDVTASDSPKFMTDLEKKYSKAITSRTWKTVHRILKKMQTV